MIPFASDVEMAEADLSKKRKYVADCQNEFNAATTDENKRQKKVLLEAAEIDLTSQAKTVENLVKLQTIEVSKQENTIHQQTSVSKMNKPEFFSPTPTPAEFMKQNSIA